MAEENTATCPLTGVPGKNTVRGCLRPGVTCLLFQTPQSSAVTPVGL